MAYMERAEELMTSSTCSETDSLSVNVTPRIFNDVTRAILSNVGGDGERRRFRLSRMIISTDFDSPVPVLYTSEPAYGKWAIWQRIASGFSGLEWAA